MRRLGRTSMKIIEWLVYIVNRGSNEMYESGVSQFLVGTARLRSRRGGIRRE